MLRPINAQTQAPLGIFNVDPAWLAGGIQGGFVGYLAADGYGIMVSNPATAAKVQKATPEVIGLVDDSSTGSGYSTMFGSLQPRQSAASLIGPNTIVGSGKCTLWTQAGLYLTDQLTTGQVAGSPAEAAAIADAYVYATVGAAGTGTSGKLTLTAGSNGDIVGKVLALTGTKSHLLESLVSPVTPLVIGDSTAPGNQFYLIYFFGAYEA